MMDKRVQNIIAFVGFIILIGTTWVAIDSHYAKAEEFKKLELRLEQKIISDRSDKIQERIWKLEDRYPDRKKAPQPIQEMWRSLEKELTTNDIQLNKSIQEIKKK